jgi:hypothetical protein
MAMSVESKPNPAQAMSMALTRARSAFLAAQRPDDRVPDARNIADLLERGHRSRSPSAAMLLDVLA